ncbi:hypothetical protein FBU30_003444 [Linnemannia zychae]|nr:hypothetical protein FBU30_003444 [Linnemannia zychae]
MPVQQTVSHSLHEAATFGQGVFKRGQTFLQDFKDFVNKGNAFDLAVAFILAGAISAVFKSLVEDIITPIFGLANNRNLDEMFLVIRCVFYILRRKELIKDKKCPYCGKDMGGGATRCPFCTTWLDTEVQRKVETEYNENKVSSGAIDNCMSTTTLGTSNGVLREKGPIDTMGTNNATLKSTVPIVEAGVTNTNGPIVDAGSMNSNKNRQNDPYGNTTMYKYDSTCGNNNVYSVPAETGYDGMGVGELRSTDRNYDGMGVGPTSDCDGLGVDSSKGENTPQKYNNTTTTTAVPPTTGNRVKSGTMPVHSDVYGNNVVYSNNPTYGNDNVHTNAVRGQGQMPGQPGYDGLGVSRLQSSDRNYDGLGVGPTNGLGVDPSRRPGGNQEDLQNQPKPRQSS